MMQWRFFEYVDEAGNHLFGDWYSKQDAHVRTKWDDTLLLLKATRDWTTAPGELFKVLNGPHASLGEIRFHVVEQPPGARTARRRRFRPVGPWPAEGHAFIILLGCEKSGRNYTPANAFDLALGYARDLNAGKGTVCEL